MEEFAVPQRTPKHINWNSVKAFQKFRNIIISPTNRHLECEIGFRGNCIYDLSLSTDNKILFVIFIRKNKIYFIDGKLPDDSILADLLILIKFIPFDGDNRTPNELLECPS